MPWIAASVSLSGCMALSPWSPTRNTLSEQVGHNISEMLPEWKGSTPRVYPQDGGAKAYVYAYGYHAPQLVQLYVDGVANYQPYYTDAYTDCFITFYTDSKGVVTRYEMKTDGRINMNSCGPYISGYKF